MARTQISGRFIEDQSVERLDINTTTSGKALITKVIVNSPLTISSTGVDSGTGDVTLGLNTSTLVTSFNSRTGAVTLNGTDVTNALGFVPISGESDTLDSVLTRGSSTIQQMNTGGYSVNNQAGFTGDIDINTVPPLRFEIRGGIIVNVFNP